MQPTRPPTRSRQPDVQRRALYQAPHHVRRRRMTLPLSRELRTRYGRRRLPVRKGDTVRVMAGSFLGREERVARVDLRHYAVVLDNVTLQKADKKLKQLPISTGHLMITKLNLADPWRRRVLKAPEEPEPEEEPEAGTEEEEAREGAAEPDRAKPSEPAASPKEED